MWILGWLSWTLISPWDVVEHRGGVAVGMITEVPEESGCEQADKSDSAKDRWISITGEGSSGHSRGNGKRC